MWDSKTKKELRMAGMFPLNMDGQIFDFTILVRSRLEPEKRIDDAIRVLKKVIDSDPERDIGMVIQGDGSMIDELEKLVEELGIIDRVCFQGWVK